MAKDKNKYPVGENPWYYILNGVLQREKKPFMPGDQVHLKSREGCFTVHYVYTTNFVIMKNRKLTDIPWEDFRCLRGEGMSEDAKLKRAIRYSLYSLNNIISSVESTLKSLKK